MSVKDIYKYLTLIFLAYPLKNVKNVITSVNFLVKENRNTIDVKIDENIPTQLLGDSLKISQIFPYF